MNVGGVRPRRMRFTLLRLLPLLALAACKHDDDVDDGSPKGDTSLIVFGLEQRADGTTVAGHEYQFIGWEDVSFGPWAAKSDPIPGPFCRRLESLRESARPHVGDGGRARFVGGALPGDGLVLDANGAEPRVVGRAFDPAHPVTFVLESGFAVPRFDPVQVPAPSERLAVTSPSASSDFAIDTSRDLRVEWTSDGMGRRVMVTFTPDEGAAHVRCFADEWAGFVSVPAKELAALGGRGAKGTFAVASQRQVIVTPGAGWVVEVIATAVAKEQRFTVN